MTVWVDADRPHYNMGHKHLQLSDRRFLHGCCLRVFSIKAPRIMLPELRTLRTAVKQLIRQIRKKMGSAMVGFRRILSIDPFEISRMPRKHGQIIHHNTTPWMSKSVCFLEPFTEAL